MSILWLQPPCEFADPRQRDDQSTKGYRTEVKPKKELHQLYQ